jgi:soluble lytic murein transglycosylase-like protein
MALGFSFSVAGQVKNSTPQTPQSPADAIARQQESVGLQRRSIERQREAVRPQEGPRPTPRYIPRIEQAEDFQGWNASGNWASAPPGPRCEPVPQMLLQSVVHRAATAYSVAPSLINAVIHQESGGYPCAVSEKGAIGLMQLMPGTASELGVREPFDVDQNVNAGTRLLADLMARYKGDLNRVLAAYNAGSAAVDKAGGPPAFPETLNYIRSVLEQIRTPLDPKLFDGPVR